MKKYIAFLMATVFSISMMAACTPKQTDTVKAVYPKVTFYSNLARSMIQVAETHYASNTKVSAALAATRASLVTLETIVATIEAGTEKDESKLAAALGKLVGDVFVLIDAIKSAKAAAAVP